jgi:hypothetical protein
MSMECAKLEPDFAIPGRWEEGQWGEFLSINFILGIETGLLLHYATAVYLKELSDLPPANLTSCLFHRRAVKPQRRRGKDYGVKSSLSIIGGGYPEWIKGQPFYS